MRQAIPVGCGETADIGPGRLVEEPACNRCSSTRAPSRWLSATMGITVTITAARERPPRALRRPSVDVDRDHQCPVYEQYFKVFGLLLNQLVSQVRKT